MATNNQRTVGAQRQATLAKEKFEGHWAIAYGTDDDGIRRAFQIRIDDRALSNFPKKLVMNGTLEPYSVREEWTAEHKFSYYDGKKVKDAVFFRHCYSRDDLDTAFSECSAFLGEHDELESTGDQENNLFDEEIAEVYSSRERNVGKCPLTKPLSPVKQFNRVNDDPDFAPSAPPKKRRTLVVTKKNLGLSLCSGNGTFESTMLCSNDQEKEVVSIPSPDVCTMIRSLQTNFAASFNAFGKQLTAINKRISHLEGLLLGNTRFGLSGASDMPSLKKEPGLFQFEADFFKSDDHSFMWMGVDTRKQINGFIAFLEVDLQKSNLVIRHVAEWLLGAHNHFDFRLTVDSRSKADCRVDYFSKDPSGDSIVKYVLLRLAVELKVAIKKLDPQANDEAWCENYRSMLLQSPNVMKMVLKLANQVGLDLRKGKRNPVEKPSLYWSLLDMAIEKPNSDWSIFCECDLVLRRGEGQLPKEKTSDTYQRMLALAQEMKNLKDQDEDMKSFKDQYDDFGILKDM